MKAIASIGLLISAAAAAPATLHARCTDPPPNESRGFTVVASRTGSGIDQAAFDASGLAITLHGNTTTYCPSTIVPNCPVYTSNLTVFACADYTGAPTSCWMSATVPGGQQLYVNPSDGQLGYTPAHSASMPTGALTEGFSYDFSTGYFSFTGAGAGGLVACPQVSTCEAHSRGKDCNPWKVCAALPGLESQQKHCLRFVGLTTPTNATAWQYT